MAIPQTTVLSESLPIIDAGNGINARHPLYVERARIHRDIQLLSDGGYEIKLHPEWFLQKRDKEPTDVYQMRLNALTYQNLIGSAIGWYASAMFREEWTPIFKQNDSPMKADDPTNFYARWAQNVDRKKTTFSSFLASVFAGQLKYQDVWVLTDKPQFDSSLFANRAAQTAAGANDPYCVLYEPPSVINWDEDELGVLRWVVTWTLRVQRDFQQPVKIFDRWTYYDKTDFTIYEALRPENSLQPDESKANETATGKHALAESNRVPLQRFGIPKLFWLSNRAYPQALDHLNQDNAFRHMLHMANLPVPAVFGDYEEKPMASETALNVFPKDTRFEYLETKGTSFAHSADRLAALREEIYRMFYLTPQGRDSKATPAAASGISKQQDWIPSTDMLRSFAHGLRQNGESMVRDVADARGEANVTATVSGTDFGEATAAADIATLELLDQANIPSDTLEKCVQTNIAMNLAKDEGDEIKAKIRKEIADAPTKSEILAQQQQQAETAFAQSLQKTLDKREASNVTSGLPNQ